MITYRKALPKDFPHILDFLNMVFSMSHCPHDFRQLLPKIYKEGQEQKSIHYLALEMKKLKPVYALFLLPYIAVIKPSPALP